MSIRDRLIYLRRRALARWLYRSSLSAARPAARQPTATACSVTSEPASHTSQSIRSTASSLTSSTVTWSAAPLSHAATDSPPPHSRWCGRSCGNRLVDVDLSLPVYAALRKTWPRMSPGGIILVDGCDTQNPFRARDGFRQFCGEQGLPERCEYGMGVLRPADRAGETGITRKPPGVTAGLVSG